MPENKNPGPRNFSGPRRSGSGRPGSNSEGPTPRTRTNRSNASGPTRRVGPEALERLVRVRGVGPSEFEPGLPEPLRRGPLKFRGPGFLFSGINSYIIYNSGPL